MSTEQITSPWTYLLVWVALLLLLAVTVASALVSLGTFNIVINYAVAIAKMLLVMVFFMHLKTSDGLIRLAATAGFFWLLLLIGLSLSDYLTRQVVTAPW